MRAAHLDWSDVEVAAKEMAGNHREFACFAWWGEPEDSDNWAIVYTHHRDSGLLDQSNADAIAKCLEPFDEDVISQRHNHWAVGHIDGYVIRVFRENGTITEAFLRYCELMDRMSDYPVLDEEDYSRREYEATLDNIREAGRRFVSDEAPDGWEGEAFSWFWDNCQGAIENRDDQGGYPSDDEMKEALGALGFLHDDYCEDDEEEPTELDNPLAYLDNPDLRGLSTGPQLPFEGEE